MPDPAGFVRDTAEHYPYPMELVGEDRVVVAEAGLLDDPGTEEFVPEYAHKLGIRVLNAEAMHRFLIKLTEQWPDSEEAGSLACDILGTLGYEWI